MNDAAIVTFTCFGLLFVVGLLATIIYVIVGTMRQVDDYSEV